MMLAHERTCRCGVCRELRRQTLTVTQPDRDVLAAEWAKWNGTGDGEVRKLQAGQDGNPGSPRFIALQAVVRARLIAQREGAQ